MPHPGHITEEEIHDYIDGRLDDGRAVDVSDYLASRPGKAAYAAAIRKQNRIFRKLYRDVLSEPVPDRLLRVLRRPAPR